MANIITSTNTFDVNVDINTNTVNVSSTPSVVELNLEPKLTLQQIRNNLFADSPLTYDSVTGTFDLDTTAQDFRDGVANAILNTDIQFKQFSETVVDAGNVSGSLSVDLSQGSIYKGTVTGNITNITGISVQAGSSFTVLLVQDSVGGHQLDVSLMSDWNFIDQNTDLATAPFAETTINAFYDGSEFYASVSTYDPLTTDDIVEGSVNLFYTDSRARNSIGVTAPLEYDSANGVISIDGSALGPADTDQLPEGNTNLYYTNSRVNAFIQSSITTTDIDEGDNLYYTNSRVDAHLLAGAGETLFTDDVTIQGNLEVQGNVDYVNVEDLLVKDHEIVLNFGNASAQDAFITVDRSGSSLGNAQIRWNETADAWEFSNDGVTYQPIPTSTTDLSEGTNLYYTDQRARDSVSGSGDLSYNNATGVFSVTTYKSSDFDTDFATKTTSDLTEGTNLYYTDGRANSAIDARVDSAYINSLTIDATNTNVDANAFSGLLSPADDTAQKAFATLDTTTTDDVPEGSVNFYYTDSRSRAAISTDSDNIPYDSNTGVVSFSNALSNVNSITSSTNTPLTLSTVDNENRTIVGAEIDNPGYSFSTYNLTTFDAGGFDWFEYTSNTPLTVYRIDANTTQGSNIIDVNDLFRVDIDGNGDQDTVGIDFSNVQFLVGMCIANGFSAVKFNVPFDLAVAGPAIIQSVDESNSTITVSKPATVTDRFDFNNNILGAWPTGYDSDNDYALVLEPGYARFDQQQTGITDKTELNRILPYPDFKYAYPSTGFASDDFEWSVEDANSFVFDNNILSQQMVASVKFTARGAFPKFDRGFTVGTNSALSNRGLPSDQVPTFGAVIGWDGLAEDFPQVFKDDAISGVAPQILMNSFSDKNFLDGAGRLFFQSFTGNINDPQDQQYPRSGQGLGRVQWGGATKNNYLAVTTTRAAAALQAYAASDWIDRGTAGSIPGNTNVYLNATTDKDQGNDLFLSFDGGELFLASGVHGTDGAQPISLGPAKFAGSDPVGVYNETSTRWATVNYSNTSAQSGSEFTVTNGGSLGVGTVGDLELSLLRNDNTASEFTWTGSFAAPGVPLERSWGGTITTSNNTVSPSGFGTGESIVGLQNLGFTVNDDSINPDSLTIAVTDATFSDGTEIVITGAQGQASQFNGGTYYTYFQTATPEEFYTLYTDSGLTQQAIYQPQSSGVTQKEYTFRLQEQSNDLEILVDGALHSTIKANGEIHNAAGSKYITESDFPTLLQDNAALIQQIAGANVEPDYDGGSASTTQFDSTADGGSASTTNFTDTVDGGNAEGNSIVDGGSSSTTVYASTTDGGNASTTEFDQTQDGGNA